MKMYTANGEEVDELFYGLYTDEYRKDLSAFQSIAFDFCHKYKKNIVGFTTRFINSQWILTPEVAGHDIVRESLPLPQESH